MKVSLLSSTREGGQKVSHISVKVSSTQTLKKNKESKTETCEFFWPLPKKLVPQNRSNSALAWAPGLIGHEVIE